MHHGEEADIDGFEHEPEGCAGDGALEPRHLAGAGDDDAADTLHKVLLDVVDGAVAIQDGDAERLEDRRTPRRLRHVPVGTPECACQAEDLEDDDRNEKERREDGDVEGIVFEKGHPRTRHGGLGGLPTPARTSNFFNARDLIKFAFLGSSEI